MMWKNLQNTILPNEYVQRMQTFKQADKMNATSYRYNDMSYRITNRQRDLMLLYHWLTYRMTINLFVREADKNILSE